MTNPTLDQLRKGTLDALCLHIEQLETIRVALTAKDNPTQLVKAALVFTLGECICHMKEKLKGEEKAL